MSKPRKTANPVPGMEGKTWENITGISFINISVCTNVERDKVAEVTNIMEPTGIRSKWVLSEDEKFASGEKNPSPCPDGNDCIHYLLHC